MPAAVETTAHVLAHQDSRPSLQDLIDDKKEKLEQHQQENN
jgi:hypothetical protein